MLWLLLLLPVVASQLQIQYEPRDFLEFRAENTSSVNLTISSTESINGRISFKCSNPDVCNITSSTELIDLSQNNSFTEKITLTVNGLFVGKAKLIIVIDEVEFIEKYSFRILRSEYEAVVSKVFSLVATFFIVTVTFMIGTQLEFPKMYQIMQKPIGPMTGFVCQFLVMPLFGFFLAYYFLDEAGNAMRLAFFAVAVSPGGGKSSFWTIIFDGNLDLSVCMTFIETCGAMVMTPFWIYTLGSYYFDQHIQIEYKKFAEALLFVLGPTCLGMLLIQFRPNYVNYIKTGIKYLTWTLVIVFTAVGIYANYYVFYFFTWKIFICSCLLPWSGYVIAFLMGKIAGQDFRNSITIAIETGIQNIGIALSIMLYAFPELEKDLGMVIAVAVVIVTDKPLLLIWLCLKAKRKFSNDNDKKEITKDKIFKTEIQVVDDVKTIDIIVT